MEPERSLSKIPLLLVVNVGLLVVCCTATPLLLRYYFVSGGGLRWLESLLQTGGWPAFFVPITLSYLDRRRRASHEGLPSPPYFTLTRFLLLACASLGLLTGTCTLLYSYGESLLPASTTTILGSTQLAFTAVLAFFIVRQRFTAYSVTAVVLLCLGAVALGLGVSGDRPAGETVAQYVLGFAMILIGSAVSGAQLPLVELTYARSKREVEYTYGLVIETQLIMSVVASIFSLVGMIINNDFEIIPKEAEAFVPGKIAYYCLLVGTAVICQFSYLGIVGTIFYASALLSGVLQTVLIPVIEVLAVILLHEPFTSHKGVALALALCGFVSYFYGDIKEQIKKKKDVDEPLLGP